MGRHNTSYHNYYRIDGQTSSFASFWFGAWFVVQASGMCMCMCMCMCIAWPPLWVCGTVVPQALCEYFILEVTTYILHPTPYTLHPTPYTLQTLTGAGYGDDYPITDAGKVTAAYLSDSIHCTYCAYFT